MTDYIDRQAAIDAVMISPQKWDGMYIQDLNCRLRDALNALPTAQPEIIRCKDCKKNPHWEWAGCPMAGISTRKPNDFCSYAEKRTDIIEAEEEDHAED